MNSSYNSLSRCQTPSSLNSIVLNNSSSIARPSPSPKCFGKNTHMLKEDYERERIRWQQKLEEAEQRFTESSIQNSELFQTKAELKRKIIDLDKNQRPLIEQNRRLNDRIKGLIGETKKLETKLAHVQDDFLTLRDSYDRLMRENSSLKEQRAFPEKIEELSRYRSQVLEYSKCITALRQSAIEKDRRYEILIQKFKKLKKSPPKRSEDDDRNSCIGSEGSVDSGGSLGLDTIAEDLDEDIELSPDLLNPSLTSMEYNLKQQLDIANATIVELQNALEFSESEKISKLTSTVAKMTDQIDSLNRRENLLEQQLANEQQTNDLLEFQLVELTQLNSNKCRDISDKQCSTDVSLLLEETDDEECSESFLPRKRNAMTTEFVLDSTQALHEAIYSPILSRANKKQIKNAIEIIDYLQNQNVFTETELNMANCEIARLKRQLDEVEEEHKQFYDDEKTKKQRKKKELQEENENLKKLGEQLNRKIFEQQSLLSGEKELASKLIKNNESLQMEADILRDRLAIEESIRNELANKIGVLSNQLAKEEDIKQKNQQKNKEIDELKDELRIQEQRHEKSVETLNSKILALNTENEKLKAKLQEQEKEQNNNSNINYRKNVQPTGSFHFHLERRYEEQRQKISEYLRHISRLEEQCEKDRKLITQLRDSSVQFKQIEQLQAYNRELEAQFNSQMDMITALKKRLIMSQSATVTVTNGFENQRSPKSSAHAQNDVWKLRKGSCGDSSTNGSSSISTTEDEHYTSEGSDQCSIFVTNNSNNGVNV